MSRRIAVSALVLGLAVLYGKAANAQEQDRPDRDLCLKPHVEGQELRRLGRLRASRDVFRACAREGCPAAVRADCAPWGMEVDAAIPTLVVRAHDPQGRDVQGVHVFVDHDAVHDYEEGRPFEMDPGAHTLRFEAGRRVVELDVVAREGEKGRTVSVTLPVDPEVRRSGVTAADSPKGMLTTSQTAAWRRPVPTPVWVLTGVGAVGLGMFATFGILGWEKHASLRATCSPCTPDQESPIRVDYAIGDISLAASVVALGIATWLFLTRPATAAPSAQVILDSAAARWRGAF